MKATSWITLVGLAAVIGVVLYTSFEVGGMRCEVCMRFDGRDACRTVEGDREEEVRAAAITNACAQISSGVTDSMACGRTPPLKAECQAR